MTPDEFLRATNAEGAAKALTAELDALQSRLALKLSKLLSDLDTVGGRIVPSEANIRAVDEILRTLQNEFTDTRWSKAVVKYLGTLDGLRDVVSEYMGQFGTLDAAAINAANTSVKRSLAGYLTNPQSFATDLWAPLSNQVLGSVTTQDKLSTAIEATQAVITGGADSAGALVGAAQGTVGSASTVAQRSMTQIAADKVRSEFFRYQGRSIDTTRPFCAARAGKVYHRKEIEEWGRKAAQGDGWEGMAEGTDERTIFIHLGGYYGKRTSCRHVLVPLPRRDVPKEDLDRMKDKGLI
jgi:hypothetical protein